jgi:hypothetical protein
VREKLIRQVNKGQIISCLIHEIDKLITNNQEEFIIVLVKATFPLRVLGAVLKIHTKILIALTALIDYVINID